MRSRWAAVPGSPSSPWWPGSPLHPFCPGPPIKPGPPESPRGPVNPEREKQLINPETHLKVQTTLSVMSRDIAVTCWSSFCLTLRIKYRTRTRSSPEGPKSPGGPLSPGGPEQPTESPLSPETQTSGIRHQYSCGINLVSWWWVGSGVSSYLWVQCTLGDRALQVVPDIQGHPEAKNKNRWIKLKM